MPASFFRSASEQLTIAIQSGVRSVTTCMLTDDFDLVPDDPYGYREALIDAFVARDVPIEDVDTISESTLLWEMKYEEVNQELLTSFLAEREIATMIQDKQYKN